MYEITSTVIKTIHPHEAADLLKKNTYKSQRPLKKDHLANLCEEMMNGTFHTGQICLAYNEQIGEAQILNGQHQLNACMITSVPIKVTFMEAYCQTTDDMADLFARLDAIYQRSIKVIVDAKVDSMEVDWHYKTGSLMASALAIITQAKKGETKSTKAARMQKYIKEGDFVNQFMTTENRHLLRVPVVAAIITTYWKNSELAYHFWNAVGSGEYLKKTDPRLKLRTYLCSIVLNRPGVSNKEVRAKCHTAWNAFLKGETTALKYFPDKPIPQVHRQPNQQVQRNADRTKSFLQLQK